MIVENLSNQEIAHRLYISEATVKTHVSSILRKTGQPNRSQAVLYGLKKGMVRVPR
ncbi:response regulator transcription factor [Rhodococcus rhodochrous]|uniref:response regulator transcription factor n=1 Tax=Rhodococcus rhodochrous TaxID=1829 RepID=UPI0039F73A7F